MPLKWRKVFIADERYESAGVFDVNNDGVLDIVSGAYWYEGPDFKKVHRIGDIPAYGEYFDDFSTIAMDVNGDGYLDYVTGGWWGGNLRWRENPQGGDGEWPEHVIGETGSIETTRAWDVDGDGQLEIVPNTPGGPLAVYKLVAPNTFEKHVIWNEKQGHGLGFGDITGNGRGDFVLNSGWLEAPADPYTGEWIFHELPLMPWAASVPVLVVDVNGDGLNDLIVGNAHGFGLDWWEQTRDGGKIGFIQHHIDPFNAQYHDMIWADIDGDGVPELVTGKRHRAHCGNDPGERDDYGIYYFKWTGDSFAKQVIDYGRIRDVTGVGIYFALADLRGIGRLDIVAPGKDGLYVFYNEGQESY